MRSDLRPVAAGLVRAWTRVYTHGLPRAERTARLAEIDSDLWESEHDPRAPRGGWAAMQILGRLLIGIPDEYLHRGPSSPRRRYWADCSSASRTILRGV